MKKKTPNKVIARTSVAMLLLGTILTGCSEKSTESHLADARGYVAAQQLDAAIVEYKNAIQKSPDAAQPRFELGKLYLQQQNFAAAEKELNKALELGYAAGEVIPLLSLSYQRSGAENALADLDYRAQGMTSVESAEVGFYKLQALLQLGKQEEAKVLLDDLTTLDTSSVYKGLIDSYVYIIDNDVESALAATEALKEQAPLNKDVLQQLAKLYIQNDEVGKAADAYGSYVTLFPDDVVSKFAYASLLVEEQQLDKAEPIVDELLKLNDAHPLLNTFKGIIESAKGNYAKALSYLDIAVQNGRSDLVVRLVAGFSAYQIQDFEAAQRHLTMIASSLPDNHPGLRMLADSMLQLGDNDEALAVLSRVEGEQSADAALFSKASYQLLREGNVVGAQQMVEKSEAVSSSADDLSRLGILQLSLNDVEGLVNLEQAVEKAPGSATSQSTLLRAYIATGQLDKANTAALAWHESAPDEAMPLVYLGSIAVAKENFDDAKAYLDEAASLGTANNEVSYAKAKFLIAQGKKDEAIELVNTFLKTHPADIQALSIWYALSSEKGDAQQVLDYAQTQLNQMPDDLNLRVLLARMYSFDGNMEKTVALLDNIEGDDSSPMAFWNLKGQALVATNSVDKASALFDRWLSFYPQDKNAVLGKLLILDSQNQFKQGLTLAEKTLEKRNDAQLTLLKAYFYSRLGQAEPAWEIINATSEEIKALPFVRGIIARLHLIDNKPADAVEHAEVAYEAAKNADNVLLVVAALEMSGAKDKAFAFLSQHVGNNGGDIQSSMLLAERQLPKDRSAAMATYAAILEQTPDNFVVLNNLAYLALEDNKLKQAEEMAKRAVALRPRNAETKDTLAQVYIAKGDKDGALKLYDEIMVRPVANDEVYLNYVELLLELDNKALAQRRLASREFTAQASKDRIDALKTQYSL